MTSGDSVFVQVGPNGTAPTGGTVVTLTSDNGAVRVPATITIPGGSLGLAGELAKTVRIPQAAHVTVTVKGFDRSGRVSPCGP